MHIYANISATITLTNGVVISFHIIVDRVFRMRNLIL